MDERLTRAVLDGLDEGKLPCPQAHTIAQALGVEPLAVGQAADAAGVRIARCQLGLFGYGSKAEGTNKIVGRMESVPPDLEAALRAEAGPDGLTCLAVWQVADRLGFPRLEASNAVEGLDLRVATCQLGCFRMKGAPRSDSPRKGA